jgi:indolepyruvate ferredoxin oxidoreductase
MDRSTIGFTQMGGEGVPWVGQQPFTTDQHVFANLGDGTYFHSGLLAIRQSIAAGVNITYKILYNDAVAMTGGQQVGERPEGHSVLQIAESLHAEGAKKVVIVTDEPEKYEGVNIPGDHVAVKHRDLLDEVQREFREIAGTTAIIYDQTCATEKRRRRKRGKMVDPAKRVMINAAVCEGCGDCGVKSNCVSVLPLETEFGRKREIDQSNCNKDFSCVQGFCPSFVTVKGGGLRKRKPSASQASFDALPMPAFKSTLAEPWNILVTGIGGTGVVTIGALIGMAAHLEHKGGSVLDQTGLAQKGGAVTTHVRIARDPADINAVRIAAGEADLVLGCDMVVVNDYWALSKIRADRSHVLLNSYEAMPGTFTRNTELQFPAQEIIAAVRNALGGREPGVVDASELALALMGDAIATNLFMLGYAWQQGLVPLSLDSLMRAVELNGAAIEMNRTAFAWGRMAAHDPDAVRAAAGIVGAASAANLDTATAAAFLGEGKLTHSLDESLKLRAGFLTEYQDAAYAKAYTDFVAKVRAAEAERTPGLSGLSEATARYLFKLMAYKDEYEVARLYTSGDFEQRVRETFDGDFKLHFNLAPPRFAKKDAQGRLLKREYGPWVFTAFKVLKRLKFLRGSRFDIFGHTGERRMERQLIVAYKATIEELLGKLSLGNHALAVEIARIPESIRGYGHVKEHFLAGAIAKQAQLLAQFRDPLHVELAA